MMHSSEQGAAPSSPRGRARGSNLAKFSLLGQQLKAYNSSQRQQLFPPPSSTIGFSVGSQPQASSHSQSHPRQEGVSENGEAFHSLNQAFPFGLGQEYNSHLNAQLSAGGSPMLAGEAQSHAFMNVLSVVQQKIAHLQALVQLIAQGGQSTAAITQQQMATAAGVASGISQLVIAASGMIPDQSQLPSQFMNDIQVAQLCGISLSQGISGFQQNAFVCSLGAAVGNSQLGSNSLLPIPASREPSPLGIRFGLDGSSELNLQHVGFQGAGSQASLIPRSSLGTSSGNLVAEAAGVGSTAGMGGSISIGGINASEKNGNNFMVRGAAEVSMSVEDRDVGAAAEYKDEEEDDTELLPPGSYELMELDAMEILAEHTHFCDICGKGFKRDANLRMHMRGHGDEYKTAAALARPDKSSQDPSTRKPVRYSCPYIGCKRNKRHRKFQPLKTMLCVKNHYRRSHCPKMLTCGKCKAKKFSVVADLKTHEKHCGREKWQCSCGTTFSRKDKLLGHIGLFAGHTPAITLHEPNADSSQITCTSTR
ncbi:hypothetical protein O6H91_15G088500 [Diphasiastrum complanatum]|uniref:Uncharacterized protein n=1 Tax=Diphasiastrum complanatum TaxID=34168 RepID=A0ACC2BKP2_DIPCM|nr:hypothetical protein O6H91_15G088500 [Diphasiastrum complanatum]